MKQHDEVVDVSMPLALNEQWQQQVREHRRGEIEAIATQRQMSAEEYGRLADERLATLLEPMSAYMRVTEDILERILLDVVFRNQFETATSGGLLDSTIRAKTEYAHFGVPNDADPQARPVYGYLYLSTDSTPIANDALDQYGSIAVRFNDTLRPSLTFTIGDSLDETGGGQDPLIAAMPLMQPSWVAATPKLGDILNYTAAEAILAKADDLAEDIYYIEAQAHKRVTLADVREVIFLAGQPSYVLITLLREKNVAWYVVQRV